MATRSSHGALLQVAEIVGICRTKGYVQPKIYQAMYNAITRAIEPELVPCCRKYGIRIVVYNPLACVQHYAPVLSDLSNLTGDVQRRVLCRESPVRFCGGAERWPVRPKL